VLKTGVGNIGRDQSDLTPRIKQCPHKATRANSFRASVELKRANQNPHRTCFSTYGIVKGVRSCQLNRDGQNCLDRVSERPDTDFLTGLGWSSN
jgi:hypothetical protein